MDGLHRRLRLIHCKIYTDLIPVLCLDISLLLVFDISYLVTALLILLMVLENVSYNFAFL